MTFSFKDCHPHQTPLTMDFGQNIVFLEKRGIYIFFYVFYSFSRLLS